MESFFDVLGLGSVGVDFIGTVDCWPEEGNKQLLQSLSIHDGGLVGTALAVASRLGGKAGYVGSLGKSDLANRAIHAFQKDNVDVSLVLRTQDAEPIVAMVMTNIHSGERNIFWTRQGVQYPFPDEISDQKWYEKTKVFLFDNESGQAGLEAAKIARLHGLPIVIDVEKDEPHVNEAMACSNHLVVSKGFATAYTGMEQISDILESLRSSAEQTVIITCGDKGCAGLTANDCFKVPALPIEAVDTTGCGDVFHGAYALAIARGMPVKQAAQFANVAAALSATKIGGRDGIPTLDEVNRSLHTSVIYENMNGKP